MFQVVEDNGGVHFFRPHDAHSVTRTHRSEQVIDEPGVNFQLCAELGVGTLIEWPWAIRGHQADDQFVAPAVGDGAGLYKALSSKTVDRSARGLAV
ncbi:hypothetical protein ACWGII_30675 [Streptomyces sp. NPDC054855]